MRIRGWWLGYNSEWNSSFHVGLDLTFWKRVLPSIWLPFLVAGIALAVRARRPVFLLTAMILVYPLPYYFTIVSMRYRFPIEPLILVIVAFCLTEIFRRSGVIWEGKSRNKTQNRRRRFCVSRLSDRNELLSAGDVETGTFRAA